MDRAPNAEVRSLLERLTRDITRFFASRLRGLYLHGSLVTGDFDPARSDLDLLAVLSSDVGEAEVEPMRALHAGVARDFPAWNDRIEVEYVSVEALRTFRTAPRRMVRVSPGEPLHLTEANRHYLLNWYMARGGVALFGPSPQQVIPEISHAEFVDTVRAHARNWAAWVAEMRAPGAQAYAVLTLCRALYSAQTGQQASKKRAARAVQERLPQWSALIEWAGRERYAEQPSSQEDRFPQVVRFVEDLSDRIAQLAEKGSSS